MVLLNRPNKLVRREVLLFGMSVISVKRDEADNACDELGLVSL